MSPVGAEIAWCPRCPSAQATVLVLLDQVLCLLLFFSKAPLVYLYVVLSGGWACVGPEDNLLDSASSFYHVFKELRSPGLDGVTFTGLAISSAPPTPSS